MKDFDTSPPPPDSDPTKQLLDDMAEFGLDPGTIIWDGRIHRFPGAGKKRGNTSGWCIAFLDRKGAQFGDFSTGVDQHWMLKRKEPFTQKEKDRWAKEKRKRDREQAEKRATASEQVRTIWKAAEELTPGRRAHPYLYRKEIDEAPKLRRSTLTHLDKKTNFHIPAGLLLIPMYKRGKLVNVQRIWPDGKRRFWPGAEAAGARVVISGESSTWEQAYIVEGWATGHTIHKATGAPVVVAFSASNMLRVAVALNRKRPKTKIIIAADNDRWTKTQTAEGWIPNPGLVHARKAAEEVDGEVVIPDFEDLAGEPTDFDDLRLRDGPEAVQKWLDPTMADKAVTVAETDPEDEDGDPGPEPLKKKKKPDWQATATFRCLGYDHGIYYVASERTGQVRDLTESDLGRSKAYYSLAPKNWWRNEFPQKSKPHFDLEDAASELIEACIKKGVFHTGRYRGRGAWRTEDGGLVLHLGDRLLAPGDKRYTPPEKFVDADRIYPRLGRLAGPAREKPFTLEEAQALLGMFEDLSWENQVSGLLLAGHVVIAPFSGYLRFRPHCWLTGPTECGKSTIINEIVSPLLQCMDRIHREAHMTSEAALRQKLRGDARPVILDEADMVRQRAKSNLQGLFDLARSSSTGGVISKGSVGGTAMDFQVRSMFLFASIVVGLSLEQDKNRMCILSLKSPKVMDPGKRRRHWTQLQQQILELVSPENGRRLMARTAAWFRSGKFDELLKITSQAAFHQMQSARAAELYGTLVAGAWTLKIEMDDLPTVEEVTAWMKDAGLGIDQMAERAVQHSHECLGIIMQQRIPISINHIRDAAPVGQLIDVVAGQVEDIGIKKDAAEQALRQRGLIIEEGYLCVANTGEWLKKQYKDTPYEAGWKDVLRRFPGAIVPGRKKRAVRFYPGYESRVTQIPLESWQISGF